jgi:hypothetical protein
MPISSIERNLRFSELTMENYRVLKNRYNIKLLESLQNEPNFISLMESSKSYIKPKNEIKKEAEALANHKEKPVAEFGKAVLEFLAKGVLGFDRLCLAISTVLLVGGVVLAVCISLILTILIFAVMVIPIATLTAGLGKINKSLKGYVNKDKNVKKYEKLAKNIQAQKDGIKDIKELDKLVATIESIEIMQENPNLVTLQETADLFRFISVIERKMEIPDESLLETRMAIYENLGPDHLCYNLKKRQNVMESTRIDDTDLFMNLKSIVSKPLLSGAGLLNGMIAITTEACDETSIYEFLNRYKNTVLYEMRNEKYRDLPILMETGLCLKYIRECCSDVPDVMESCDYFDQVLGEIIEESEQIVSEEGGPGFNPDPFGLGSLTPMPVADRVVADAFCDIIEAETDAEITEAMTNFGRIAKIINESYEVGEDGMLIVTEGIGSAARGAAEKVGNAKAKVKGKLSPMERFIENQYAKLKKKDSNERRRIIMQGGDASKAFYKVWRWVKRGIGLAIGAGLGQYCTIAALATGIAFIGFIASDKYLDAKERAKILRELEDEIAIVNEKIDDSRGDDNKQKKYELMRIRNELQRQKDRISYNLPK